GTKYAILTTEIAPHPDQRTGQTLSDEDMATWQRVRPIMKEILQGKGLTEVAEDKVRVTGVKGPLEDGWQQKVAAFVAGIPVQGGQQRRNRAAEPSTSLPVRRACCSRSSLRRPVRC